MFKKEFCESADGTSWLANDGFSDTRDFGGSCAAFRRLWLDVNVSCGRPRCNGPKLSGSLFDGLCGFECATPLAVISELVDASKQALDWVEFRFVPRDLSGLDPCDVSGFS